jgi:hypothetical protein
MEYKVLNLSLIQYYFLLFKDMKESKCESSSLWLNAKKSSKLIRLYVVLIVTGLLNLLDYLSLLSFFIWYLYGTGTGISSCFLYY